MLEVLAIAALLLAIPHLSVPEIAVATLLLALAFAPSTGGVECWERGGVIECRARIPVTILAVQRGEVLYLPNPSIHLPAGTSAIALLGDRIAAGGAEYRCEIAKAAEPVEGCVIYISP